MRGLALVCVVPMFAGACGPGPCTTVQGVDGLECPESVLWANAFHVETLWFVLGGPESESDVYTDPGILWSSAADTCEDVQARLSGWADATAALLAASDGGADAEAFCAAVPDFVTATQATLDDREASRLRVGYCADDGYPCTSPPVGSLTLQALGDEGFEYPAAWGGLEVPDGSLPDDPASEWDGCASSGLWSQWETAFELQDGALVVEEAVAGDRVSGTLEGAVVDESGQEVGAVEVAFDAPACDLPDVDALLLPP